MNGALQMGEQKRNLNLLNTSKKSKKHRGEKQDEIFDTFLLLLDQFQDKKEVQSDSFKTVHSKFDTLPHST